MEGLPPAADAVATEFLAAPDLGERQARRAVAQRQAEQHVVDAVLAIHAGTGTEEITVEKCVVGHGAHIKAGKQVVLTTGAVLNLLMRALQHGPTGLDRVRTETA